MSKLTKNLIISGVMTASLALVGCGSDNDGSTEPTMVGGPGDILQVATSAGSFNTLAAAIKAADLVSTLESDGPFTVFAPVDAAFEALPDGTLDTLLMPENRGQLTDILTYHVVAGEVRAETVVGLTSATTVNGADVGIEIVDGKVVLNGSVTVTQTDVLASNGVIHVIDGVLLPPAE